MFWAVLLFTGLTTTAWAQTEPATAWGWIAGSSTSVGVSGTYNGPGAAGTPGSRTEAITWTDQNGVFWLFGGYGRDAVGTQAYLNDLWKYTGGQWIFISGATTVATGGNTCISGTYLTQGAANAGNVVGGRSSAVSWVDNNHNLWLFGGEGCDSVSTSFEALNDLWMYNTTTGLWTWEGGSNLKKQIGVYGVKGAPATTYLPGARIGASAWTGADGSFWLFGGTGIDSSDTLGSLNDLWKFDPTANTWTWVAGILTANQNGSYGNQGIAAAANTPGSRSSASATVDPDGNFWLYGGQGYGASLFGNLSDTWKFDSTTQQWTWVAGSKIPNLSGNYGTQYEALSSNAPGARYFGNLWSDKAGNLWLFGGFGLDSAASSGDLNDLWEFDVPTAQWTWMGGASTVAAAASYGSMGTPATNNIPGSRDSQAGWNDGNGNFWLMGGSGYISPAISGTLNDLWEAIPPPPTPSFSLTAGTYTGSQTVTISEAMDGVVYYTTDGSTPTTEKTQYSAPVVLDKSATLKAIAVVSGRSQSLVRSVDYTIQQTPVITWTPAQTTITYGTTLAGLLNPSASYGGSPVAGNYSFTTETGATVTAISVLPAGTHTLTATLTPTLSSLYTTATASVTVVVNQATPTINWGAAGILPAISYGTALSAAQLDATATGIAADGQLTGTFTYSPAEGTVLQAGTQNLTVIFAPNNSNYATTGGAVTITVNKVTPTVSWLTPAAIPYGTRLSATQLNATATVPGTFIYTLTSGALASGALIPAGTQTLIVNFTPTDTGDYNMPPAATVQLLVSPAVDTATWPTPQPITYGTVLGATQLNASCLYASQPIAYTEGGISVSGTIPTAGTHTLTATCTPTDVTGNYSSGSITVQLVVNKATPAITWSPTPLPSLTYGSALTASQLNAICSLGAQSTIAFTTESGQPVIVGYTALTAGTHTLTATCTPTDTTDYNSTASSMQLIVNKALPVITWGTLASIGYGTPLSATQLNATAAFGGAAVTGAFTYSPAAGTVLSVGTQTLEATFVPTDTTNYATVTASNTLAVTTAMPSINWQNPAAIPYGTPLSAVQLNATSPIAGSFSYSPAAGTFLTVGTETISVTFTPTDTTDYSTATAQVTLTVTKANPVITWPTPAPITYGTALSVTQLNATSSVTCSPSLTYFPTTGTILTAGNQTLTVTCIPKDNTDYNTVSASVVLVVNPATVSYSWPPPAAIAYGTPLSALQLDASASMPGVWIYTPGPGTILPAGTQTLAATFIPTDSTDYSSVFASVPLVVGQGTPILTWQSPAPVPVGTTLSSVQLNATANVPGTFSYSPAAGTVLATAGTQTLAVAFTPSDTVDYTTATTSVQLTVTPSDFSIFGSPTAQVLPPGGSTTYILTVTPENGPYNSAVTFSVVGLPSGITATFSPTSVTPGSSAVSASMVVSHGTATASNALRWGGAMTPFLALLLGLGFRRVRKSARRFWMVLLLTLSLGATVALSGCGGGVNLAQNYTITVTGTSGSNVHSTLLVLTVQ